MKSNRRKNARACVALCAVGLLVIPFGVGAEDDFELFIEPIIFEVLQTDQDGDSSKFQEYRDLSNGFRIPLLVIKGYGETTDRHLAILGDNIWREDAQMILDYGVWGHYAIDVDYNKIPHRFGNNGTLLWNITGPGELQLADSTQEQLQTAIEAAPVRDFDLIESLLQPYLTTSDSIDLLVERDRTAALVEYRPMQKLSWALEYKHENRYGHRAYGGSYGFNNTQELPEPIDYETDDATIMGEWSGKISGAQFGFRYSKFDNNIDTLIWDNPFRAFDTTNSIAYLGPTTTPEGPTRGLSDLAPSNEANTLFLSGRSQFAGDWWVSGKISSSRLRQNDPFPAYTINTSIVGIDYITGLAFDPTNLSTLPAQEADLETDLLSIDADLGTDFGEDWKLKLSYDYYDYDASVPRLEFDGYVRMQAVWEEVPRVTVPYSYSKETIGARLTWDVSNAARLSASTDVRQWTRENRETNSSDEYIFALTYDHRFNSRWNLRARWERGDRDYDRYETEAQEVTFLEPEGINNQPGLRKYQQANREYDDYKIDVFYDPTDTVQLMFGLEGIDTDYPDSEFGLLSSELVTYYFEVSYVPTEIINFFAFGNISNGETFQAARQSGGTLSTNPLDDWSVRLDEDNQLFGLGLNARLKEHWTTDVVSQWTEGDGFADFFTLPGGAPASAEDIDNYDDSELFFVKVTIDYAISDRSSVGFWYWYEDYTLDSYLIDNLTNYEAGLIALNAHFDSYEANVFGVYLSLDF